MRKIYKKTIPLYTHILDLLARAELREIAEASGIPRGKNKKDTIRNLRKHRGGHIYVEISFAFPNPIPEYEKNAIDPAEYEIKEGDVWRKPGPSDWFKVGWICLPGFPEFDGALPGVSVTERTPKGRWTIRYFKQFAEMMQKKFRWLVRENENL
jgi:hypothetical protein